jgi:hypothetical protein
MFCKTHILFQSFKYVLVVPIPKLLLNVLTGAEALARQDVESALFGERFVCHQQVTSPASFFLLPKLQ